MSGRTFCLHLGLIGASLLVGFWPRLNAQTGSTQPRQIISANILGYAINPSAMAAFNGCLASDTGCTMEVIICYGVHGAAAGTAPLGCIPLPAKSSSESAQGGPPGANYDTAVYFERAGGTELPNGALSGPVAYAEVQVAAQ